ncbi:membrane integrity-associated transporter subunit PqiC [Pseudomonas sp. PDM03]|uniref:PqiC family protein n=1 Tax=Pseudomonas TaxID=286 RepID=UPI0017874C9D|nr:MULTISPECIES: PqiC family protein [Pseudomonas]MBD9586078.1 membrane integrity-associated transporter subunit PqiC [Pseudomonas sp. PDM03]MCP1518438.1 putative lipoprotein YmbA [Pseudomonas migulae]
MAFPLKITLVTACLLLAACRSDPIQFHTLTPAQLSGTARGNGGEIQIESLSVPPQVDRPQIVIRQGNSGLAILETQWWAASLVDELRSALVDQLANSSPQRRVSVRLDVQRFDSIPGQYGLIDVKWRLRNPGEGDSTLITCRSTLQTPSGPSIDDLVVAQQNNVKRLAALISQAATTAKRGCPSAN